MGYIHVVFKGDKTAGGYLTLDPNDNEYGQLTASDWRFKEKTLSDGMIIRVKGTHTLMYDSLGIAKRGQLQLNINSGMNGFNIDKALESLDEKYSGFLGNGTYTFDENSVLTVIVTSDAKGNILRMPEFVMRQATEMEIKELEDRLQREEAEKHRMYEKNKQKKKTKKKMNIIAIIINVILFFTGIALAANGCLALTLNGWLPILCLVGIGISVKNLIVLRAY